MRFYAFNLSERDLQKRLNLRIGATQNSLYRYTINSVRPYISFNFIYVFLQ